MLERFLTGASTYSQSIDHLIFLIAALVGFWLIVAEVFLFWLIFKYRQREGRASAYVTGEEKHLKRWITVPHMLVIACDVLIIIGAVKVWIDVKQTMPPAEQTVRVFAQQWAWSFQDPGPDGSLDTADDILTVGNLHVKVNTTYHFELRSRDVVHSFCVPSFRLKQDAVPGRVIAGWFRATRPGTYDIQCTQMCGIGHSLMAGRVIVETSEQHASWIKRVSNSSIAAQAVSPAVPAGASVDSATPRGSELAEVRP
jgi:cytochrome c oxidase subunit 2